MNIIPWNGALVCLLYNKFEDEGQVKNALNSIYAYISMKSCGRSTSIELFDAFQRDKMISDFFESYKSKMTASQMCETPIMKSFIKNDGSNNLHLDFILKKLVASQLSSWPQEDLQIINDPKVISWLVSFYATTADPEAIKAQKLILDIPEEYQNLYVSGRNQLGDILSESLLRGWINSEILKEISLRLAKEDIIYPEPLFNKESIIDFFVCRFQKLIEMGGEYKEQFRKAARFGLITFSKNPLITKKPVDQSSVESF